MAEMVCAQCNKPAELKCSACKLVAYCDKEHQKQHWKTHKGVCRAYEVGDFQYHLTLNMFFYRISSVSNMTLVPALENFSLFSNLWKLCAWRVQHLRCNGNSVNIGNIRIKQMKVVPNQVVYVICHKLFLFIHVVSFSGVIQLFNGYLHQIFRFINCTCRLRCAASEIFELCAIKINISKSQQDSKYLDK